MPVLKLVTKGAVSSHMADTACRLLRFFLIELAGLLLNIALFLPPDKETAACPLLTLRVRWNAGGLVTAATTSVVRGVFDLFGRLRMPGIAAVSLGSSSCGLSVSLSLRRRTSNTAGEHFLEMPSAGCQCDLCAICRNDFLVLVSATKPSKRQTCPPRRRIARILKSACRGQSGQ